MRPRLWVVGAVVVCASISAGGMTVAGEAMASPTLGFESSSVLASNADASADMLAGSRPFALTTSFKLNTTTNSEGRLLSEGGDLADVMVELPAGLTVDPLALPLCGAHEFATFNSGTGEDGCPNASAVGVVEIENVTPSTLAERKVTAFPIYDLAPPAGSPALFGFKVAGFPVYLTPSSRTGSDYGLTVAMTGIPQGAHVLGSSVTFWGVPAEVAHDHERGDCVESHGTCPAGVASKPLLTLPTQCSVAPIAALRADSWQGSGQFTASASDPLAGSAQALGACQALDFAPTLGAQAESSAADTPTGLTIHLHMPQSEDPAGLGEAQLEDAVVTLPAGMTLNLSRANGLVGCPLEGSEGIDLGSGEGGHCPQAARIGGVKVKTPFLSEELQGGLYVAQQGNLAGGGSNPFGSLLALYIVAEGSGVVLKLPAEVIANPETGQLTLHIGPDSTTGQAFAPQLSLADLQLEFSGGAQAAIITPATCGNYTTSSSLTPWNGAAPATPTDELHITQGCAKAFSPSFAAGTVNKLANAYSPLTIALSRQDGEQEFKSVSATLPEGLLAILGGVELCPEPQASLGTCGPASLIGHASSSVGAGPEPFMLTGGKMFLTGPYGGGSFGLSLVMPAVAGPFNLGPHGRPLVIRAAIHINPRTGQATAATDASGPHSIPSILEGILPQIKTISIAIDRPEFTFNPSNCAPLSVTGTSTSTQGATASVSTPFQSTGCAALPFAPKLTASVVGSPSRKNGIGFNVRIVEGFAHESNAHSVKVELPKQLPSRLSTLQKACLVAVFEANPATCPPGSIVGTASAVTSVLPVPIAGPVYFVSHGGAKFPEVVMVLQGYGVTIELFGETFISKAGITSTTFPEIPEAPVPSFELRLPAGPDSALTAHGDLCASSLRIPTTIVAYNGLTVKESPRISVGGCRPALKVVRHGFRGHVATVVVQVPSAGRLVASGHGFLRRVKTVGRGGAVTVKLALSTRERRLLAHHRGRPLKLAVKLTFVPRHGARLSTRVAVVVR
jgi:hypothetical protein